MYARFARGRPGAIVVEATGIRDIPSGPLLRISNDSYIDGLSRLVDIVREASAGHTKLFIQCIDFLSIRRRPDPERFLKEFLRITESYRETLNAKDWDERQIRDYLVSLDEASLAKILDERDLESLRMGYRERVTDMHLPQIAELQRFCPTYLQRQHFALKKQVLTG